MIGEVRDTLYDLRTDVTESQSLSTTLEAFLERVKDRSGLDRPPARRRRPAACRSCRSGSCGASPRRRSPTSSATPSATQVTISWRCDGTDARLEVADDGIGFPVGQAGRLDSYGLLGMRERAASIGATLVVDSEPGRGTRVRCTLDAR